MKIRSALALAGLFVALAVLVLVGIPCRQQEHAVADLIARGRDIGLMPVPSRHHAPDLVFLVRDPATWVEPDLIAVPGQQSGWVRVRRCGDDVLVCEVEGQVVHGDCELIGDESLIRQLLDR